MYIISLPSQAVMVMMMAMMMHDTIIHINSTVLFTAKLRIISQTHK